jgi:hypothetical protein
MPQDRPKRNDNAPLAVRGEEALRTQRYAEKRKAREIPRSADSARNDGMWRRRVGACQRVTGAVKWSDC